MLPAEEVQSRIVKLEQQQRIRGPQGAPGIPGPPGTGQFAQGSYTGDGAGGGQTILVGFNPTAVQIVGVNILQIPVFAALWEKTAGMPGDNAYQSFGPLTLFLGGLVSLVAGGFKADGAANDDNGGGVNVPVTYYWTAQA